MSSVATPHQQPGNSAVGGLRGGAVSGCSHLGRRSFSEEFLQTLVLAESQSLLQPGQDFGILMGLTWGGLCHSYGSEALGCMT